MLGTAVMRAIRAGDRITGGQVQPTVCARDHVFWLAQAGFGWWWSRRLTTVVTPNAYGNNYNQGDQ